MRAALIGRLARLSLWRAMALAGLAGLLAAAGQAPVSLWGLALAALMGVIALVASAMRWQRAAWIGWAAGAGYFGAGLYWIVDPFMVDAQRYAWMAPFALFFMAGGMALFWALAAGLGAALGRNTRGRAFAFVLALAASGLLRAYLFTGFPWGLVSYLWIGTPVALTAAWVGPYGLTLLTLLGIAAPFLLRRPAHGLALGGALLAALAALGEGRLHSDVAAGAGGNAPVIRLVQPDATQRLKWRPDMIPVYFDRLLGMTAAGSGPRPALIVWPESAVPWLLNRAGGTDGVLARIARAARGVPVVFGINRRVGRRYFNSLVVLGRDGRVGDIYDKHHLVPFGEYVPFGNLLSRFGIQGMAAREGGGFSPGPGPRVISLPGIGPALPLICYEAIFPQDLRVRTRPRLLLQITNDGWFGTLAGPYQHLAQARMRAIEQGLPMVRVANTGVSAMIDAHGRLLASIPLGRARWLDLALPPALSETPYARTGDGPMTLIFLAGLAILLIRRRWRKLSH